MRLFTFGGVVVAMVLAVPVLVEHASYRGAVRRLEAAETARAERFERLKSGQSRGPKAEALAKKLVLAGVGPTLPVVLRQLGDIAGRARLAPSAVLVLPPVRVDVERASGPSSWLEEYPVQLTIPGSLEALTQLVEELGAARLPLRVDWVRMNDKSADSTRGVVMQLGIRVLVPGAAAN